MQMISVNFSGTYLEEISNLEGIRAFGAIDVNADKIAVMLLNIDASGPHTCMLRLNSSPIEAGECRVNIPAGLAIDLPQKIGSQTSIVLIFNLHGKLVKTVPYAKDNGAPEKVNYP